MLAGGWKLGRGRGSIRAQLPFAICMMLAFVTVLLGRAEASIFDEARAKISDWSAPVLTATQVPIAVVQGWATGLSEIFSVQDENLRLREENETLRRWQDVALSLEQRVSRYESLLNAVPDPDMPSVTARVIGQSSQPFSKTLILNAGTDHNVRKGQAVLDDRGLLGRIFVAGENTSWVLLLTDLNSRIPVVVRPSNRRAILSGNNSLSPTLQFDSLQFDFGEAEIHPGDRVYSTGDGGLLPPDLPIGMVIGEAENWGAGLFADPDLSDFVQIVDYRADLVPPVRDNELPVSLLPNEISSEQPGEQSMEPNAESTSGDDAGEDFLAGELVLQ